MLALRSDGTVWTWGIQAPDAPNLDPSCDCYTTPRQVTLPKNAVAVASGWYSSYALLDDGTVWAWGFNDQGQLGTGDCAPCVDTWTPAPVSGLTDVTQVAGGYQSVYALKSDGTVWAWGAGSSGDLGPNAASTQPVPVQVTGLPTITQIAAASGWTAYALAADHTVWSWGDNTNGALGIGSVGNSGGLPASATPVHVPDLTNVTHVGAGGRPTKGTGFATLTDGTLWSWGNNSYGQLGRGGTYPYPSEGTPAEVPGLLHVTSMAGGSDTTYAVADPVS